MRQTFSRLTQLTSRLSSASSSSAPSLKPSTSSGRKLNLPPVRYHIFPKPLPYLTALNLQNAIIDSRLSARRKDPRRGKVDVLLLLEHTPTYTTGRRDNSPNPNTLHPEERKVQHVGAEFHITKRGGQVTFHGPGQLVGYPIVDLEAMQLSTRCYVDYLQRLLADYVRGKGVQGILAPHPDGHVGIFSSPTEKLASIGIHLIHRITSHGFAMNITEEPIKWFDLVTACGLSDVRATSLKALLSTPETSNIDSGTGKVSEQGGGASSAVLEVREVAGEMIPLFKDAFGRESVPLYEGNDPGVETPEEEEDLKVLKEIIGKAEEQAGFEVERMGGWATEPDLTGRVEG